MALLEHSKAYKPHLYPWAIAYAETSEKMHWHAGEASLLEDVIQWKNR